MLFELSNNSAIKIVPFSTIEDLAEKTAHDTHGGAIGLSGGSTYDALFEAWAKLPHVGDKAIFFPVDERVVPLDDPASNWGNACRKLFKPLGINGQCYNAALGVAEFDSLLFQYFRKRPYHFTTLFLGVGDDGHTASLFPGTDAVTDRSAQVLYTESPKGIKERITLSADVIAHAYSVITILAGSGKESCVSWLANRDMSRPFVSVLASRESSTLFMETKLYDLFLASL